MICSEHDCELMESGRKTVLRRLVQVPAIEGVKPRCAYRVGETYPVQPSRDDDAEFAIEVLHIELSDLAAVTRRDASAEGYRNVDLFRRAWIATHDARWLRRFALEHDGQAPDDYAIAARWEHHRSRQVWVIAFRIDEDAPLYLARDSSHGMTIERRLALTGEPEPVSDHVADMWAKKARSVDEMRQQWDDQQLLDQQVELEQRLARARELAKSRGIDVSGELRVIQQRVAAIERKATRQAAA